MLAANADGRRRGPRRRTSPHHRYFTNDYDTETKGVDAVLTRRFEWRGGSTDLLVGYNRTRTNVKKFDQASTQGRRVAIERGAPGSRLSVGVNHATGAWDLSGRFNYFGSCSTRTTTTSTTATVCSTSPHATA